jgi:hypothetical protein
MEVSVITGENHRPVLKYLLNQFKSNLYTSDLSLRISQLNLNKNLKLIKDLNKIRQLAQKKLVFSSNNTDFHDKWH